MAWAFYRVPYDVSGRLWVMPCPTSEENLTQIAQAGAGTVLSMLPPDEAAALGMAQQAALCAAQGVRFRGHPVPDFGLPDQPDFSALIADLAGALREGAGIAVHCRAGIGRSGMVAACVGIALGQTAPSAIAQVSAARGVSIPDTVEQGDFIASFAQGTKNDLSGSSIK